MTLDLDTLESLAKAASDHGEKIGEESWYSKEEFVCNMLMHQIDAEFSEACTPAAILSLIAEVRALREESARLDFMLENDAFTVRCNRDGSILQYQLMTQDEDENYHVLHHEHRFYNTERDAIDAARKEKA